MTVNLGIVYRKKPNSKKHEQHVEEKKLKFFIFFNPLDFL